MSEGVNALRVDAPAERNYQRYEYAKQRGHTSYTHAAARNEAFYLGAGRHWSTADRQRMFNTGRRPTYEINEILGRVNAAVGYQIHNRMDISFLPRGGMADSARAAIRSKVVMQICDHTKFHWKETQVFTDGLIEQRGYFDIRMCFEDNVFGDADVNVYDPRDVVPDTDAKSYDPKDWADVIATRWLTLDEIEGYYGKEARDKLATYLDSDGDWGELDSDEARRNKFGNEGVAAATWDSVLNDVGIRKYRVIDRQFWVYERTKVAIYSTGDVKLVDGAAPEQLAEYVQQGAVLSYRMKRRVKWQVTSRFATLFDDYSPYDRFTIIPFFCFFRRGVTLGLVDNAISPQEVLNKAISQFVQILNSVANSGWLVEQGSLVNMDEKDLEDEGSKTGLVITYKQDSTKPEKILPNQVPAGMDRLIEHALAAIKSVTVPDSMLGMDDNKAESGIALQSRQFVAQNQLAIPLDNLARTRHMCADMFDYLITHFYDNRRVFRITETDPVTGQEGTVEYVVNDFNPRSRVFENDLTEGDYDVVVTEQPMQITFENSQYTQAIEMRDKGVKIPDDVVVKHSNLSDKPDIIKRMADAPSQVSELDQASAELKRRQAEKAQADTAQVRITSQFGAVEAGKEIALNPGIAPLADQLTRSAGVVDQDAPPEIPAPAPGAALAVNTPVEQNTSPQFPAKPASPYVGADAGIEGGGQ
jgi:hypothetical protein